MNRVLLLFLGLTAIVELRSQSTPVFGWQSHFSYHDIRSLEWSDEGFYASTDKVLYFFDSDDNSINFLNEITGISDIGIGDISYSEGMLAIGYQNGNLDLIENGLVNNVTTILDAPNLDAKAFNSIQIINNELWGGLEFGMIRYDLTNNEFTESYQNIGQNGDRVAINDFVITADSIITASDNGILSVSLDDETNRQDFNFWQRQLVGLSFTQIESFQSSFYASIGNDLFKQVDGNWQFLISFDSQISDLYATSSQNYIVTESAIFILESDIPILALTAEANWGNFNALSESNSEILVGTSKNGLLAFSDLTTDPVVVLPPGPFSDNSVINADSLGIQFWVTDENFSIYEPSVSTWAIEEIIDSDGNSIPEISDIELSYAQRIVSNFNQGPFLQNGQSYQSLNEEVSTSNTLIEVDGSLQIPAIEYAEGQLWIVQNEVNQPLSVWTPSTDQWQSYRLTHPLSNFINDITIIDNQDKWMPVNVDRGGGILVFDEEDNGLRYLNTNGGQGGLPGREITDIEQDQNRFIWITTNEGICYYPNPEAILAGGSITATIPIYDGGLLLRDEYLTALAIDPANRKWIATRDNGVWLFNETGEELMQHFTAENSPLPSNEVNNVTIDPTSGLVFFTTSNGIASFRSDATEGTDKHENVRVYPNPVQPLFNGLVVIEGLVNNALLKLTDVSGKLVREIQANGSTATWDVRDLDGARVQAGVYLVFSSNRDGSETYVAKIVVI